jgi:hypothetical protein
VQSRSAHGRGGGGRARWSQGRSRDPFGNVVADCCAKERLDVLDFEGRLARRPQPSIEITSQLRLGEDRRAAERLLDDRAVRRPCGNQAIALELAVSLQISSKRARALRGRVIAKGTATLSGTNGH